MQQLNIKFINFYKQLQQETKNEQQVWPIIKMLLTDVFAHHQTKK